jgi:signal transduction histidine kinase
MSFTAAFWAFFASLIVGFGIIWTNPTRALNRALLGATVHLALWLLALHLAFTSEPGESWLRLAWALGGGYVWQLWLLKEAMLMPEEPAQRRLLRSWPWLLTWAGTAALTASSRFFDPTPAAENEGWGLYGYASLCGAAFLVLVVRTAWQLRGVQGGRRLELQILLLGGCAVAIAPLGCGLIGSMLGSPDFVKMTPVAVFGIYGGTVWSIVTYRVIDARHIVSLVCEKAGVVITVALFVWGVQQLAAQLMPGLVAFVAALALGLWFAAEITPWLQELFHRHTRRNRVRHLAFEIAREELRPEAMEDAFTKLLREWGASERAVILMGSLGRLSGGGLEFAAESPEMKTLHGLRWATPERLARERCTPEREALAAMMARENFGAIVASIGPSPALVVGLTVPLSRRPFTFPEIGQLLELAAIIENSLSRAHYLMKSQHAEQLATVGLLGASIAHEIRNPLVSIKTFVQLLPKHYQDAAFRDKFFRLIGDEVGRIDRLTEQLLDLAAPRVFSAQEVQLHTLLHSCLDLMAAKAEDKGVKLLTEFHTDPDTVFTDPNAVKQVMLNLGFNAIQALERHSGDRWLRLETKKIADGVEVAVMDSGPGLTPEVWSRLFQPFQSTKSSGFGLGLAICKDILSSLQASINADPPSPGRGATFRIVLPCPQSHTS